MYAEVYSDAVSDALRRLDAENLSQEERTARRNAILFAAREEKKKRRSLPNSFGLGFIERADYRRVMQILRTVSGGNPIREKDLAWLGTTGREYWSDELRKAHHRILAERLSTEWRRTGDGWAAVNACSHWRKAGAAKEALLMTQEALEKAGIAKLRSALLTTRGGALRDADHREEAVESGMEAHKLTPEDFRPCTLLGALHMEMGALADGASWYEKAESLGAARHVIDRDLQSIINAADPTERNILLEFLKQHAPDRYSWVDKFGGRAS